METTTTITYRDGHTITRTGTCGMTVTATRSDENLDVRMEFDIPTEEEAKSMIGAMLVQLEELCGENFVAQCIAHYATDTGKVKHRPGKRDTVVIRGYKKGE